MLGDAPTIEAVADVMAGLDGHVPIVIDPVMWAKGGASLLATDAVITLKRRLLPMAALVTPNIPELEALTGRTIASAEEALDAARALGDELGAAVLAKGGHLEGDEVIDQLVTREGVHSWTRSDGRRVGEEGGNTCRSRWEAYDKKK